MFRISLRSFPKVGHYFRKLPRVSEDFSEVSRGTSAYVCSYLDISVVVPLSLIWHIITIICCFIHHTPFKYTRSFSKLFRGLSKCFGLVCDHLRRLRTTSENYRVSPKIFPKFLEEHSNMFVLTSICRS